MSLDDMQSYDTDILPIQPVINGLLSMLDGDQEINQIKLSICRVSFYRRMVQNLRTVLMEDIILLFNKLYV